MGRKDEIKKLIKSLAKAERNYRLLGYKYDAKDCELKLEKWKHILDELEAETVLFT